MDRRKEKGRADIAQRPGFSCETGTKTEAEAESKADCQAEYEKEAEAKVKCEAETSLLRGVRLPFDQAAWIGRGVLEGDGNRALTSAGFDLKVKVRLRAVPGVAAKRHKLPLRYSISDGDSRTVLCQVVVLGDRSIVVLDLDEVCLLLGAVLVLTFDGGDGSGARRQDVGANRHVDVDGKGIGSSGGMGIGRCGAATLPNLEAAADGPWQVVRRRCPVWIRARAHAWRNRAAAASNTARRACGKAEGEPNERGANQNAGHRSPLLSDFSR